MTKYNDPSHPEHLEWLKARRKRFVQIIREGKRTLKLLPDERKLIIELANLVEKNSKELAKK